MKAWIRRLRQPKRGVSLLFFLIMIPVIFAVAAIGVDFSRILEAHRSVTQIAEEAAQSGALAFNVGTREPRLNTSRAGSYVNDYWARARANGVPSTTNTRLSRSITDRSVTVTVTGDVTDLIFLGVFEGIISGNRTVQVRGNAIAHVCLAGYAGDARCTRPDGSS